MRNDVEVIPFGIDIDRFKPSNLNKKNFIVGTIKSIEEHNGIDCLIDAAKIINFEHKKNIEFCFIFFVVCRGRYTNLKAYYRKA